MGRQDRLRSLQVRVAGQDQVAVALRRRYQRRLQVLQEAVEPVDGAAHPELDVGDDLVIAAAAGVELAADIAEALDQGALDMGVNVLQLHREGKLATLDLGGNLRESRHNLADLRLAQQADLAKHVSVRLAGEHVLAVEPAVEADRLGEPLNALVGLAAESSSPRLLSAHGCSSHRQN